MAPRFRALAGRFSYCSEFWGLAAWLRCLVRLVHSRRSGKESSLFNTSNKYWTGLKAEPPSPVSPNFGGVWAQQLKHCSLAQILKDAVCA